MAAFEARDFQQAAQVAGRLVGHSDAHPAPLYIGGASSYVLGNLQQAREYLSRYVAMQPDDPDGRRVYGAVLLQTGDGDEAYEVLAPLREEADEDATLLALFGLSAAQAGRYDEAIDALEGALRLSPDDLGLRSQLSAAKLAAGDRDAGIAELERLAAEADNAALYRRLAVAHFGHGEFDQAIDALQRERERGGDVDVKAMTLEAMALMGEGRLDDAESLLQRAVDQEPDDLDAQFAWVELLMQRGDVQDALTRMTAIAESNPTRVEAQMNLARLELASRREAQALDRLQRLMQSNPERADVRLALIDAYLSQQRWEEARQAIARAPDPAAPPYLLASGLLALGEGRPDDAVAAMTEAAEAAPALVKIRLNLARALQAQQDFDAALAQLDRAAEIAPKSKAVRIERIRQVLLHPAPPKDRWASAKRDLAELQQTDLQDAQVVQLAGIWAMRSDKRDQGIELLKLAHDNLKTSDSAIIYADALWALDRKTEADSLLASWLDTHPTDGRVQARLQVYRQALAQE
jgi:tetratricopeptide (TPR) repeat protein